MDLDSSVSAHAAWRAFLRTHRHFALVFLLASAAWLITTIRGAATPQQTIPGLPGGMSTESMENQFVEWIVAGRVTTLGGTPIPSAEVRVEVEGQPYKPLRTNLQGEFGTSYRLNIDRDSRLSVRVSAAKNGYYPGYEIAEYTADGKTWVIDVILREKSAVAVEPALANVVTALGPKLLEAAGKDQEIDSRRKEFRAGTGKLMNGGNFFAAFHDLQKVVARWPNCAECRALLGLAQLGAGSWASALREINQAATLVMNRPKENRQAAPLVLAGVTEEWRAKPDRAAGFFSQALAAEPANALALEEMGRALLASNQSQRATPYLEKAIQNNAPEEARLMLGRAQFLAGKVEDARAELTRFRADGGREGGSAATRLAYADLDQQLKVAERSKIVAVVSQPLPELQKALPDLEGLEAAADQQELPEILRKTGENVELFFRTIPNTISHEEVQEQRLDKKGKPEKSLQQSFQYLLFTRKVKEDVGVEEYRGDLQGRLVGVENPDGNFMLTRGFTSLSLVFYPAFQASSKFRLLGRQSIQGRKTLVMAFAQTPMDPRLLEHFNFGSITVPVLQQGVAWFDAESFQLLRMRTELLKVPPEIDLERQTTDVTYDKVQFKEEPSPIWLPREVAVTVACKDRQWHNLHRYSDFRLFQVKASEHIRDPKPTPQATAAPD
jgi:tetratricopeptide (TPR) repeat protein